MRTVSDRERFADMGVELGEVSLGLQASSAPPQGPQPPPPPPGPGTPTPPSPPPSPPEVPGGP